MSKVALVALVLFVIAMVLPELRGMMLVGGVGVMIGAMIGMQHAAKHTTELHADRAERVAMRTVGSVND